jgi:hypothetical protein
MLLFLIQSSGLVEWELELTVRRTLHSMERETSETKEKTACYDELRGLGEGGQGIGFVSWE